MNEIYLDNAATTRPVDTILDAIKPYIEELWYNPSSLYNNSSKVYLDIERARILIASLINAERDEIYFTSGASESNNWVIRGFDDACGNSNVLILTTPVEHKSIIKAVGNRNLSSNVQFIDVDCDGLVNLDSLSDLCKSSGDWTFLASVIAANNEIGSVNDLKKISEIVHVNGGIFHTDATQMLPHMPIDVKEMGIDLLSASAQKLGGLKGTGFLYIKKGIENKISPLIYGEQENGKRGGTENVVGIMAMNEAVARINYKDSSRIALTRNYFIDKLENIGCKLIGSKEHRLPNNISVMLPENCGGEETLYLLDMSSILVSTGSACNSHEKSPSHVLKAIGLTDEEAARVIRITFSSDITIEDIDRTVGEIEKCIKLFSSNDWSM